MDHCHITGKFRGPACNTCNLKFKTPRFLPVFFHNLTNYDLHLFIRELGVDKKDMKIIPQTEEKYISLTKSLGGKIKIRFLDSFRFMASSLDSLSSFLPKEAFSHMRQFFPPDKVELLLRKGIYPYDYMDDISKCNDTHLPPKSSFFNKLNESSITDEEYAHALNVWKEFQVQNLGEYTDLYVKSDVLLLTDIFENFRNLCLTTYKLDPVWYYTAPGLSWDAMLKMTNVRLELFTDYDMLLFVEKGIRGGISQCSNRYAKANNKYLEDFDPEKPSNFLMYFDANNLYGWAMSQPLPISDFSWINEVDITNIPDDSSFGYILEVDIQYPTELHDTHSDFPFTPENTIPPGCKEKRLLTTMKNKKNYAMH